MAYPRLGQQNHSLGASNAQSPTPVSRGRRVRAGARGRPRLVNQASRVDFIRPKAPEGRAVVTPDLAAMAPQAFVPPQNADLLAAFADYLNAPRLAQSFWGAENPPWDVASAMAAEDAALNAEFDPNTVQPAFQPVLPVTPDRVMAEAGDPATVLPVDAGVDPATGVQYPVKPEYLRPSPPPVRDAEAERKKREDALRVGLLLPALATVTGGDLSLAMRSTPATAADALAGARSGADRTWKDVLDAYGLSTDYTNSENRLRAQEYEDAFNEAYRRDIQSQRAGTLALGQSKENRLGQSLKFRQSQAEAQGFDKAISQLKSFGSDVEREAALSSPSFLAAYGLTDLDPVERAALSTLSTFHPDRLTPDEQKMLHLLDWQIKKWSDPMVSVRDKPRLYGDIQETLRGLRIPGFEGSPMTMREMTPYQEQSLTERIAARKKANTFAERGLANREANTELAKKRLGLYEQMVNATLTGAKGPDRELQILGMMDDVETKLENARKALGENEALSATVDVTVEESTKAGLSSEEKAEVEKSKEILARLERDREAHRQAITALTKIKKGLNDKLYTERQRKKPAPKGPSKAEQDYRRTYPKAEDKEKALGGGGKAAANAGFARPRPKTRPKTIQKPAAKSGVSSTGVKWQEVR